LPNADSTPKPGRDVSTRHVDASGPRPVGFIEPCLPSARWQRLPILLGGRADRRRTIDTRRGVIGVGVDAASGAMHKYAPRDSDRDAARSGVSVARACPTFGAAATFTT